MTANDLQTLLVTTLARQGGGSQRRWRIALGPVRVYDSATHPHCNWSVAPSGGEQDVARIEDLLDQVRIDHPIVTA